MRAEAFARYTDIIDDWGAFAAALERYGEEALRRLVLAGAYRLMDPVPQDRPSVNIFTTGVMAPEALAAAEELDSEGVGATVINLTSPDRVYRSWRNTFAQTIKGGAVRTPSHLHRLLPPSERRRPVISVHDAASHSLAWIGSALGAPQYALGVDRFGESGTVADLHRATGICADSVVNAALIAISELDPAVMAADEPD